MLQPILRHYNKADVYAFVQGEQHFEPLMKNRFRVELEGLPAYMLQSIQLPAIGRSNLFLTPLILELILPLAPSGKQFINDLFINVDGYLTEDEYKILYFDLGPVGDDASSIIYSNLKLSSIDFGKQDFYLNEIQKAFISFDRGHMQLLY